MAPGMVREREGSEVMDVPELLLYPNPNSGDQVHLFFTGIRPSVQTVSVDLIDLSGRVLVNRKLPVHDGLVDQLLELGVDIASGTYVVKVTAGEGPSMQRLVVQR